VAPRHSCSKLSTPPPPLSFSTSPEISNDALEPTFSGIAARVEKKADLSALLAHASVTEPSVVRSGPRPLCSTQAPGDTGTESLQLEANNGQYAGSELSVEFRVKRQAVGSVSGMTWHPR
jgi:hypothetical protein